MPPKPPLTHFLCLPLVTPSSRPQLLSSLNRFTTEVTATSDTNPTPLPSKAVRPVGALHFTIGVLSLRTPERVEAACNFLKELDILGMLRKVEQETQNEGLGEDASDHIDAVKSTKETPVPLNITLTGIHPMQSPSRTSSLYTSPSPTNPTPSLLPFASALQSSFLTAGFLLPDTRAMKMHATIVNTIYSRSTTSGKKRWKKDSGKIDGRGLIERYADYEWAKDIRLDRVAICEMGAKKIMEGDEVVDQVYTEIVSVPLPSGIAETLE